MHIKIESMDIDSITQVDDNIYIKKGYAHEKRLTIEL